MKLYLVHCGFYDSELCDGLYEGHANFFVIADSFETAKTKAKLIPEYRAKKMHVDSLQEILAIEGHRLHLIEEPALNGHHLIVNNKHRDLAPKKSPVESQLTK